MSCVSHMNKYYVCESSSVVQGAKPISVDRCFFYTRLTKVAFDVYNHWDGRKAYLTNKTSQTT